MFPKNIYHCPCVNFEIKLCLVNGHYSLDDICKKLNEKFDTEQKIYCSKCGYNLEDAIFSCRKHMSMLSYCEKHDKECKRCIKRYLQIAYRCCYDYTSFDLPISIKKENKTLCLIIKKIKIG